MEIAPVGGRLPSKVLGLHLQRQGERLRLYDPAAKNYLLTPREHFERAEAARQQAEAQVETLRCELEALRRGQARSSD